MRFETRFKISLLLGLAGALMVWGADAGAQTPGAADGQKSCPPVQASPGPAASVKQDLLAVVDKSAKGELAYWNKIKDATDAMPFLAYVASFPHGMFVDPAIGKYRQNCGDLSALPPQFLSCVAEPQPLADTCHRGPRLSLLKRGLPVSVPDTPSAQNELSYWNAIKQSDDPSVFLVYINKFPKGTYYDLAVDGYKRNCGDLGALPLDALACVVEPPLPPAPPPVKKVLLITPPPAPPPPALRPPPIKVSLPPVKPPRPKPPVTTGGCGGTTFASLFACTTGHGPGGSGGTTGTTPGSPGGSGGGTPGQPPASAPPGRPLPPTAIGTTPVPVSPPVAAP